MLVAENVTVVVVCVRVVLHVHGDSCVPMQ